MKVAIYSRYSTDQQDKTSIAGQVSNCEALVEREGFEVFARYQDEGQSGNDDSRPGYQAMLEALSRGDFTGIVCDETSRITRNQTELHRLCAELRFRDQFLITCDGIDTRSESSDLVLSVKAAIDAMEGRKIGYRTYRSLRERHKAGYCAGGRIYGYAIEQDGEYKRRVVESEQAEIVREIFERYADGEGAKTIARDLNNRGIPSPGSYWNRPRANGWVNTTISGSYSKASGILRNPIYSGQLTWNKRKGKKVPGTSRRVQTRRPNDEWITVQDESLRIVPQSLWERVQRRLEQNRASAHPNNKGGRPARYLLSGLLTCADCGAHYILRNGRSYSCASHSNGRDAICNQKRTLKREKVEQILLEGIKAEYMAPKVIKELAGRVQARLRQVKRPDQKALKSDLNRVDKQIENVIDALADVGRSKALSAKLKQLESERDTLRAELNNRPPPPQIVPNVGKHLRTLIGSLEDIPQHPNRDDALNDKAREAVRALIGNATVVEDNESVYAEIEMGRACITHGAQERT